MDVPGTGRKLLPWRLRRRMAGFAPDARGRYAPPSHALSGVTRAGSPAWQRTSMAWRGSWVQIPSGPPFGTPRDIVSRGSVVVLAATASGLRAHLGHGSGTAPDPSGPEGTDGGVADRATWNLSVSGSLCQVIPELL